MTLEDSPCPCDDCNLADEDAVPYPGCDQPCMRYYDWLYAKEEE